MPFLDDAVPAGLAPQIAEPIEVTPPVPPFSRLWDAAMTRENTLSSLRESICQPSMAPFDPSFDPFNDIKGYEDYASAFVDANRPEDVDHIKMRIDAERRRSELLDQGGVYGMLASLGAGTLDPINLIPVGGQGVSLIRSGRALALSRLAGAGRGAARLGAGFAAGQAAQEAGLQATQLTRPWEESVASVGMATVVGSCLGGAVGVFRR